VKLKFYRRCRKRVWEEEGMGVKEEFVLK